MVTHPRLTPKVRDLVAVDRLDRPSIKGMSAAHIAVLVAVARKPQAFAVRVSAPRAIEALARGAKADVSIPVLADIVSDRAAPTTARVVAARELGRIATANAERALARRVAVRDPRVKQAVLWGLGTLGGPTALRELAKLAEPPDPAARRQLVLARALIAHRHGLDGPFLPETQGMARSHDQFEQKITLTLRMKTAKTTAADRKRMVGSTYGIDLAASGAGLTCGRVEWTVFLNRQLQPSNMARRLFQRPWIAALLGRWYLRGKALTTQHLVLTRPEGGGAHIDVVRTDGTLMYTGHAKPSGAGLRFSIADVDRPGTAPTKLTGRITSTGLELDGVVASGKRIASRSTSTLLVL